MQVQFRFQGKEDIFLRVFQTFCLRIFHKVPAERHLHRSASMASKEVTRELVSKPP